MRAASNEINFANNYHHANRNSSETAVTALVDCNDCEMGKWSNTTGFSGTCTDCVKGYYNTNTGSNSTGSCIACPAGTIGTETGQASASLCTDCPSGKYSDVLAFPGPSCTDCLKGYYNELTGSNSNSSCIACPKGTIGTETGQASASLCTPCPLGRFSDALAYTGPTCDKCGMGSYNDETGQPSCKKCPLGSLGAKLGQTSLTECKVCPVGEFSTNSSLRECNTCEEGKTTGIGGVNHTEYHDEKEDCKFAAVGWWLEVNGENSKLLECPGQDSSCAGYNECNKGYDGFLCVDCSPKFYHLINGECTPCPAEEFQFWPHIITLGVVFIFSLVMALNLCKLRTLAGMGFKKCTPKVTRIYFEVLQDHVKSVKAKAKVSEIIVFYIFIFFYLHIRFARRRWRSRFIKLSC